MDRSAAAVAGVGFAVIIGAVVYAVVADVALAAATGAAWGVAVGQRTRVLGRESSLDGPDWWTATVVGLSMLLAVPGLASLPVEPDVRLALGVAFLGVGAAGSALGEARERARRSDGDRETAAT